ncbi:interleukin-1 receptor-associated kinase 4-like [Scylla paramamosain]|uniref:interleukin-1 receptor-associated kinase 4-like n=1 Tax=Scylla paramamosain TaxID=85552 RepID=UPI003082D0D5
MQALTAGDGNGSGVTLTSELRLLPSWAKSQLAHILEVTHGWREVMGRVPGHPWAPGMPLPEGEHYPRKYSSDDIHLVSEECGRDRREGFEVLVEEWGTSGRKRPTVSDLVSILQVAKLYRAMDYLIVTVLKGEALPRQEGDSDAEDQLDQALEEGSQTHYRFIYGGSSYREDQVHPGVEDSQGLEDGDSDVLQMLDRDLRAQENSAQEQGNPQLDFEVVQELKEYGFTHFAFSTIKEITNKFSDLPYDVGGNKLGEGAFGTVYLARVVLGGREKKVAVKRLASGENKVEDQFKTEIEVLSRCIHENLLPLVGYSCDGPDWCLVYDYMANGSLQDRLACLGGSPPLGWQLRVAIGEGAAQGIVYLHTHQERPLVHRDIKSANILLDEHFTPKVGDFGLVRLGSGGTHTATLIKTTTVFGTSAYMAPEAFRGDISVKMDTFSFGIVLLELLTGLPSYQEEREGCDLLSYVQESEAEPAELLDEKAGQWDSGVAIQLFGLADLCTEFKKRRPTMVQTLHNYRKIINSHS